MRAPVKPGPTRLVARTLACLAALGVALGACDRKDGPAQGARGKTVTFWHIQTTGATKDAVDAVVARFEAAHPDVGVEPSAIQNDLFKQKLAVAMAAGSPPDVFYTWGGGVLAADARAGRVLDLTTRIPDEELARLHPAALEFCRSSNKPGASAPDVGPARGAGLWALPADVAAVVFWYNRDIFAEHGLEPPEEYEDLIAICAKLRSAGVTPLALGNSDKWPGAFYFCYFATRSGAIVPPDVPGAGRRLFSFDEDAFVEAGRLARQLAEKEYLTNGFNGLDYTRARQLFFQGRAAMILMGPWILSEAAKEAPPGFVGRMGCFAFPKVGPDYAGTAVLGGVNAGYAISAKCAYPDEAVALVRELTSLESARAWAATGRIPALVPDLALPMLPPEAREVAAILGRAPRIQLYYDQALPPELAELHKTTTQGILGGTTSPEEATRLMEEAALREFGPRWRGDFAR